LLDAEPGCVHERFSHRSASSPSTPKAPLATILVAPVSSRVRDIPTEVPLGPAQGLPHQCVANFDNILPLPKDVLVERVGRLDASDLRRACAAARFAIQC